MAEEVRLDINHLSGMSLTVCPLMTRLVSNTDIDHKSIGRIVGVWEVGARFGMGVKGQVRRVENAEP